MQLRLTVLTCGSCGKPRGRYHACAGKRGRHAQLKPRLRMSCGKCGRDMRNPFTHTCVVRTDFKRRKAAAERRVKRERERKRKAEVAARRRERDRKRRAEAAARRKAAAKQRQVEAKARQRKKRQAAHVPRLCKDPDCERYGCLKYREGYADGYAAGHAAGFAAGYAAGHDDGYAEGYADGASASAGRAS